MQILLIAHDFPPIPSPQSLRWTYLVRELSRLGHKVDVLAPDHPGYGPPGGLPEIPEQVKVHRTFPGLFAWSLGAQRRIRRRIVTHGDGQGPGPEASTRTLQSAAPVALNWKGRLVERIRTAYASMLYPDVRAEWNPWARRALFPLLRDLCPDVVIASHEPASTLLLALAAKRKGYFVVADLGDPVCAPYTPGRWRNRALRLEGRVCASCDLVLVTSQATRNLLLSRHSMPQNRIHVVPQGFNDAPNRDGGVPLERHRSEILELLYTGSFYDFRSPDALIKAVVAAPGIRLSIASSQVPHTIEEAANKYPDSIRLLGFLPHLQVLALQRQADVLVNLANADATQVPGKIYEYLGAGRPILHIGDDPSDEAAGLVNEAAAGWTCRNSLPELSQLLSTLSTRVVEIRGPGSPRDPGLIGKYSWSMRARDIVDRIFALRIHLSSENHGAINAE